MSRTIKAVERHMILPVNSDRDRQFRQSVVDRRGELGFQSRAAKLVAEWQQRGPETLSGHALRKLRFALAPSHSVITATPVGPVRGAMRGNRRSSRHTWRLSYPRFTELLIVSLATERALAHRPNNLNLANTTKLPTFFVSHVGSRGHHPLATLGDPGNFSMPAGYAQARKIVFAEMASAIRKCSHEKFV